MFCLLNPENIFPTLILGEFAKRKVKSDISTFILKIFAYFYYQFHCFTNIIAPVLE